MLLVICVPDEGPPLWEVKCHLNNSSGNGQDESSEAQTEAETGLEGR